MEETNNCGHTGECPMYEFGKSCCVDYKSCLLYRFRQHQIKFQEFDGDERTLQLSKLETE